MMMHEADKSRSPAARLGRHRLIPIAGGGVALATVLAHLGGGALVMHVSLPAALVYLGLGGTLGNLSGGALVIGIMTVAVMLSLLVFGARHWLQRR